MTKPKILLTRPWPQGAQDWLKARFDVTVHDSGPMSADQLKAALRDYDALCPTLGDRLTAEVLGVASPRVRIIANFGAGFEHIDLIAAKAAGITVSNTPDVLTDATADIALLLMLMASRRAGEGERQVRAGQWGGWGAGHMLGQSLQGKTLGLIGFGRIGQATARRATQALDMQVTYSQRRQAEPDIEAMYDARFVADIDELIAEADVLSLHCPASPATHHLIDAERLKRMKPTAILINTARGSVVDEAALAQALKDGTIWAAGLDVYEQEPKVHPDLLSLQNAVLLPHLGSATIETRTQMGLRAAANVAVFFAGETVPDRIA